tara:strand:- start:186 stop:302 length:117 start_codon:yes stop_codon:yes gene_type:complete
MMMMTMMMMTGQLAKEQQYRHGHAAEGVKTAAVSAQPL